MTEFRNSQELQEVAGGVSPSLRNTQIGVEIAYPASVDQTSFLTQAVSESGVLQPAGVRSSQVGVEVAYKSDGPRTTQMLMEAGAGQTALARASQIGLEIAHFKPSSSVMHFTQQLQEAAVARTDKHLQLTQVLAEMHIGTKGRQLFRVTTMGMEIACTVSKDIPFTVRNCVTPAEYMRADPTDVTFDQNDIEAADTSSTFPPVH